MKPVKMSKQSQEIQQILAKHPLFRGLEPHYLLFMADCATPAYFETGAYLAHEGEKATKFYLIRQGSVELGILTAGHGFAFLQTLGPDEIVGWSWLVPPHYWHFGGRAAASTEAFVFDGNRIRNKCELNRDFGYELLKRLNTAVVDRLRSARIQTYVRT